MDMGKMGFAAFTYGPDLPVDTWLDFSANIRVRPNGNVETARQCATPVGSSIQRQIGTPQTSYTTLPAVIEHAGWWALVEGAAAALEQAANHIGDLEAERAALGAAKHYRERANDLYRAGKAQDNRPGAASAPLTGDQLRAAVKDARGQCGPSDAPQPADYAQAGARAMLAAPSASAQQAEPDTGWEEADAIIGRLMSDDPDFDDCRNAAVFIRRMALRDPAASNAMQLGKRRQKNVCPHGIHMDNACGACIPPRGTTVRES